MKIVALSDTHGMHRKFPYIPDGDILIHAGDFTNVGEPEQVKDFNAWLGELPHTHKIVIAGNHDRSFDLPDASEEEMRLYGQERLSNAIYLLKTGIEIEGRKFWGSPYTPFFGDYWRFYYDRAQVGTWDCIPKNLDFLITHGPPLRHLDQTLEGDFVGCYNLHKVILEMHKNDEQPQYHVFGHIHEGSGVNDNGKSTGRTVMMNVSAVDRYYRPRKNPCMEFEI